MTPVDATSTSAAAQPSAAAVSAAISRASASPCGPVQALAQPLLVTTARARPPLAARCAFDTSTGAAWARFMVKRPAAVAGASHDDQRQIGRAVGLDPAVQAGGAEARAAR